MATNTQIAKEWFEQVWTPPYNAEAIDEMMAEDCRLFGINGDTPLSRDDFRGIHQSFVSTFPDIKISVVSADEFPDGVALHAKVTGTHKSSGNVIGFNGTIVAKINKGVFIESHETWDFGTLMVQVGIASADKFNALMAGQL